MNYINCKRELPTWIMNLNRKRKSASVNRKRVESVVNSTSLYWDETASVRRTWTLILTCSHFQSNQSETFQWIITIIHAELSLAKQNCAFGATVQSDQGLHFTLPESSDTIECINGDKRPKWDRVHAQDVSESLHSAHASLRKHV